MKFKEQNQTSMREHLKVKTLKFYKHTTIYKLKHPPQFKNTNQQYEKLISIHSQLNNNNYIIFSQLYYFIRILKEKIHHI